MSNMRLTSARHYEYPAELATFPGFADSSYVNDVTDSVVLSSGQRALTVWIEHPDPAERSQEYGWDPESPRSQSNKPPSRFVVCALIDGDPAMEYRKQAPTMQDILNEREISDEEPLLETEDPEALIAFLKSLEARTQKQERQAVTTWTNWRDIFASETVVEPGAYKRKVLHTWTRDRVGRHDRPGPMVLTSYTSVKGHHHPRMSLDVTLTPQVVETIRAHTIHIDRDTISLEVIVWSDGRALVVAQHSSIIGGTWLAKIDASTIPPFPLTCPGCNKPAHASETDDDGYHPECK